MLSLLLLWLLTPAALAAPVDQWFQFSIPEAPAQNATASWILTPTEGDATPKRTAAHLLRGNRAQLAVGPAGVNTSGKYHVELEISEPLKRYLVSSGTTFSADAVDVVLVVDTSDSMRKTDPNQLRIAALERFLNLAKTSRRIRRIGLVSFQQEAQTLWDLTDPNELAVDPKLRKLLRARGSTDFDKPLESAAKLFIRNDDAPRAVLFLTDGRPKRAYADSHLKLKALNAPIYAVGLSADTMPELMTRIAKETGGTSFQTENAEDLTTYFSDIFALIDPPASVYQFRSSGPTKSNLSLDASMRHIRLKAASVGAGSISLGENSWTIPSGQLIEKSIANTGSNKFTTTGKVSGELIASTPYLLRLGTLDLHTPAGVPISGVAGITNAVALSQASISVDARDANGTQLEVSIAPLPQTGLYAWRIRNNTFAGACTVTITAKATDAGQPIVRRSILQFTRTTDGPEASAVQATSNQAIIAGPQPIEPKPLARTALGIDALTTKRPTNDGPRATFLADPQSIKFPNTAPGLQATATVDLLVAAPDSLQCQLSLKSGEREIAITPRTIPTNRQTKVTLTWNASQQPDVDWQTELLVQYQQRRWTVPLSGSRIIPIISAELTTPVVDNENRTATAELSLAPTAGSSLVVKLSPAIPEITLSQSEVRLSEDVKQTVAVTLDASNSPETLDWSAMIRIEGVGLHPSEVLFETTLDPIPEPEPPPEIAPVIPIQPPPPAPFNWMPWLWLLLIILLIALAIAGVRGNGRAVFILASIAAHVVFLLMVLPPPDDLEKNETEVTELMLQSGGTIVEEQVQSETTEFQQQETADPTASEAAKAEAAAALKPMEQQPTELPTEQQPAEQPEQAQAREVELEVERETTEVADLQTEQTAPSKKSQQTETTEATPTETAAAPVETKIAPDKLAARISLEPIAEPEQQPEMPATQQQNNAPAPSLALTDLQVKTEQPKAKRDVQPAEAEHAPQASSESEQAPSAAPTEVTDSTQSQQQETADTAETAATQQSASGAAPEQVARPTVAVSQSAPSDNTPAPTKRKATGPAKSANSDAPANASSAAPTVTTATNATQPESASSQNLTPTAASSPTEITITAAAFAPRAKAPAAPATPSVTAIEALAPSAPISKKSNTPANGAASATPIADSATGPTSPSQSTTSAPTETSQVLDTNTGPATTETTNSEAISVVEGGPASRNTTLSVFAPDLQSPSTAPSRGRAKAIAPATGGSGPQAAATSGPVGRKSADSADSGVPTTQNLAPSGPTAAIESRNIASPQIGHNVIGSETVDLHLTSRKSRRGRKSGTGPVAASSSGPIGQSATQAVRLHAAAAPISQATPPTVTDVGQLAPEEAVSGLAPQMISRTDRVDNARQGWQQDLVLARYTGDWDCDKTAMLNLAHQLERRTGSVIPLSSKTVGIDSEEIAKLPFIFLSGHDPFTFKNAEVTNLRNYFETGGSMWINDSTDLGDNKFDAAIRTQIKRVLPTAQFRKIPKNHPIFSGPYDLTKGYMGYAIPPGDKYRQDYLEGIWIGDRLAIVYTRNDYGDGLEIDPRTHPLMQSLSSLSPAEMQEGSIRMGINVTMHFMNGGRTVSARINSRLQAATRIQQSKEVAWAKLPSNPLPVAAGTAWQAPEGWTDVIPSKVTPVSNGLRLTLQGRGRTSVRRGKAAAGIPIDVSFNNKQVILADVHSTLKGGSRLAFAFMNLDGTGYLESAPVFVKPGRQTIALDLSEPLFKSEATNWQYKAALPSQHAIGQLYLLLYPQDTTGDVTIKSIRTAKP